jgi:pimeloyl-ACP methyl ester carboxylesterase
MVRKIFPVLVLLAAGCASPIGVNRVGINQAYPVINANALTGSTLSDDTRAILRRYGLLQEYEARPEAALRELHQTARKGAPHEVLFALSEASYGAARQFKESTWVRIDDKMVPGKDAARAYDFAAAVYAYLYLFSPETAASLYDPNARIACHLYNCGLANALTSENAKLVNLNTRRLPLPMGKVSIEAARPGFPWNEKQFSQFVASDAYIVRGLSSRTREPGLGVPLIAIPNRAAFGETWPSYYAKTFKVPATVFLRVKGSLRDMDRDEVKATLELYSPFNVQDVQVNGHKVPLEVDLTAPLAYGLEGAEVWHTEVSQFFSGRQYIKTSVYLMQPYEPGKIPVVFVHGTAGSPGRWAEIINVLNADPVMRQRYQFWYFIYNTGQPIPYSAMLFRESLDSVVKELDPDGKDPALRKMVVIGHSQGGLLARLSAVSSGDRLWKNISDKSLDELDVSAKTRSLFQRTAFFEPSPYIRRVVFMCTPHRGSYRVSNFVKELTEFFVKMPGEVFRAGTDLVAGNPDAIPRELRKDIPTSVAAMKPGSRFLKNMGEMPFDPNIKRHSIIAVLPGQDIPTGNDGVVEYKSARLDDVESEVVVRDQHSCQNNPVTIEEIRRILLQNLSSN